MQNTERIQWRPWDAEAFRLARESSKPIFLSISAVWCHWCHVMDEESYDHPEVIRRINRDFIPVRVDSDKRPDINSRYNMGGWPTVAILDADGQVIVGETYLPTGQLLGMLSIVEKGSLQPRSGRRLQETKNPTPADRLDESMIQTVAGCLLRAFDPEFGGFGGPPKFPQPWLLELAFHLHHRTGDPKWLEMVNLTLDNMRESGIYDRIDGGFFRYATRGDWDNPHYEKLLEVNARMLSLYLQAYRLTGQVPYRSTAQGVMDYISTTLAVEGRPWFYASQSADIEYYAQSEEDRMEAEPPPLDRTLYVDQNATMASALVTAYSVLGDSKYLEAALGLIDFLWRHGRQPEQGMFHYSEGLALPARAPGQASGSASDWPGHGGIGSGASRPPYLNAMGASEDSSLPRPHGPPHIIDDGRPSLPGYLSDQVQMITVLIDAFETTGLRRYLEQALDLVGIMDRRLWDDEQGGYWDLPADSNREGVLKIRIKPLVENAVAAIAMIRLFHLTGQEVYRKRAEAVLTHLATVYKPYKHHAAPFAVALERFWNPPHQVTVVGHRSDPRWEELIRSAHQVKAPWKVVLPLDAEEDRERIATLGYTPSRESLAYVCVGTKCLPPISRPEELADTVTE